MDKYYNLAMRSLKSIANQSAPALTFSRTALPPNPIKRSAGGLQDVYGTAQLRKLVVGIYQLRILLGKICICVRARVKL